VQKSNLKKRACTIVQYSQAVEVCDNNRSHFRGARDAIAKGKPETMRRLTENLVAIQSARGPDMHERHCKTMTVARAKVARINWHGQTLTGHLSSGANARGVTRVSEHHSTARNTP